MNIEKIARAWIISDIHFGVRSSSREWIKIHEEYFNDFFIPTLLEHYKEGDALFVLGDVFESRQYINILVLNVALEIFKRINKILPIIMIVGNHDVFMKQSNEINSLEIFRTLDNVKIITETEFIKFNNSTAVFMPWKDHVKYEYEDLKKMPNADYLFCHTELHGFKYNKYIKSDNGMKIDEFAKFKKIYSGHIHFSQKQKNIRMVGSPLELTRGDIKNTKSIWLIDLCAGVEQRFINNVSPKFLRVKLKNIINLTIDEINHKFKNNFIDIFVPDELSTSFPFGQFIDLLSGYKKIEYILTGIDNNQDTTELVETGNINISNLIESYINTLNLNTTQQKRLMSESLKYYNLAIKNNENL